MYSCISLLQVRSKANELGYISHLAHPVQHSILDQPAIIIRVCLISICGIAFKFVHGSPSPFLSAKPDNSSKASRPCSFELCHLKLRTNSERITRYKFQNSCERTARERTRRSSIFVMIFAVVVQADALVIDDRFEVDGTPPQAVDVFERLARVALIKLGAFVSVAEVKLAVAVVVAVGDLYVGKAEVGHVRHKLVAHALPALLLDRPLLFFDQLVDEEVQFLAQLLGQVVAQERDIIIKLAHLEDFFEPGARTPPKLFALFHGRIVPATLYVLENFVTKIVGIQLPLVGRDDPRM